MINFSDFNFLATVSKAASALTRRFPHTASLLENVELFFAENIFWFKLGLFALAVILVLVLIYLLWDTKRNVEDYRGISPRDFLKK